MFEKTHYIYDDQNAQAKKLKFEWTPNPIGNIDHLRMHVWESPPFCADKIDAHDRLIYHGSQVLGRDVLSKIIDVLDLAEHGG